MYVLKTYTVNWLKSQELDVVVAALGQVVGIPVSELCRCSVCTGGPHILSQSNTRKKERMNADWWTWFCCKITAPAPPHDHAEMVQNHSILLNFYEKFTSDSTDF